jgi:hypothetical protein
VLCLHGSGSEGKKENEEEEEAIMASGGEL